jgi:hypothetical protein
MCNPYDNNPYATDDNRITNERDANRALAASVDRRIAFDEGADIDEGMTDDEK